MKVLPMNKELQLSILLVFQNQRDAVEPTLQALFELSSLNFELFIIDDASTDGSEQAIQSLLNYYQHEHTFFFEHTKPAGRGNCLNELLTQVNTNILWTPQFLENIEEAPLIEAIKDLKISKSACLIQQFSIPESNEKWIDFFRDNEFIDDAQFLWNLEEIISTQHFFNSYMNRFHGMEWLIRVGSSNAVPIKKRFYTLCPLQESLQPTAFEKQEVIMTALRRSDIADKAHQNLIELLGELPAISSAKTDAEVEQELLEKAIYQKDQGQISAALDNIDKLLHNKPSNRFAKKLKVQILERKRRFVEASELKHELHTAEKSKLVHSKLTSQQIKTSIIIPTALYGKSVLEHGLLSISEYCNPATTEIIIIDNASLDDTFDYLQELQKKNFFNCKIITNSQNKGFAASVNQGFEAAGGNYFCILHNDVEFEAPVLFKLEKLMDENPEYMLLGPLTSSTLNPDQLINNQKDNADPIAETDYLDSFCIIMRAEAALKMDEKYTLAFFDDIDLSFQVRDAGHKVGIATEIAVNHHYGTTTFGLDLDTESELYWKNIAYFNEKWEIESFSNSQLQSKSEFEQLLILDEWVNPLFPEPAMKTAFEKLFTSEMKNQILKSDYEQEILQRLVHLLMVMGERETMRRLEDRLTKPEIPVTLIYEIVRFYFKKNIYSRCLHYLDRLTTQQQSLQSELYRLAILINEKKIKQAIPKLTELLEKAPANPLLYKLAGDIYTFQNDPEEAESFYALAHQINPFEYPEQSQKLNPEKR